MLTLKFSLWLQLCGRECDWRNAYLRVSSGELSSAYSHRPDSCGCPWLSAFALLRNCLRFYFTYRKPFLYKWSVYICFVHLHAIFIPFLSSLFTFKHSTLLDFLSFSIKSVHLPCFWFFTSFSYFFHAIPLFLTFVPFFPLITSKKFPLPRQFCWRKLPNYIKCKFLYVFL
jgi:hypothetical protein